MCLVCLVLLAGLDAVAVSPDGKSLAVGADNGAAYIERAKAWFERYRVVFHTYWNSNSAFPGKLSDGQYPNSAAAYKRAFPR